MRNQKTGVCFMSCPHFYPANLLSKCLLLLLHLRLSRLPREPRERLISPCMDKSDGDRAALTQAEAFDQKATHTFPRKAVCLKPARRVYAVYRLPSGENSRWSGAAGFVWNGQFDLLSGDGFQTGDRKKLSDKN